VVTGSIPANFVATGNPARVICSIDEYYKKRRQQYIEEAKEYARCIWTRYHRPPVPADFWEEFPIFLNGNESCDSIDMKRQLGNSFSYYTQNHKSIYHNFYAFLDDCGLEGYERKL
jgi:hypothetical protein